MGAIRSTSFPQSQQGKVFGRPHTAEEKNMPTFARWLYVHRAVWFVSSSTGYHYAAPACTHPKLTVFANSTPPPGVRVCFNIPAHLSWHSMKVVQPSASVGVVFVIDLEPAPFSYVAYVLCLEAAAAYVLCRCGSIIVIEEAR